MYAQSIMLGDDELSINNFDEIMDWIIILFLYELCRIIKYRNIENKKKFLKLELVNFFIEISGYPIFFKRLHFSYKYNSLFICAGNPVIIP